MYKTIITGFVFYTLSLPGWALTPTVSESELVPNRDQEQATEIILHIIENYHYRKKALDDNLSSEILDTYLESLDPNRSFFTQQDIDEFEQYRYLLDDALDSSNLDPAFVIFKRYRTRVQEGVGRALTLLDTNNFDFSIDQLGLEVGLSRRNLFRKLKALTDMSPSQFIRTFRLKRAAQLLSQKAGSVSEIAYQTGFDNLSYFTKCFKETYQKLPSEYMQ